MENTKIEWADHTFNPWEGCTKVSPGCANCYAEARNQRWAHGANWGPGKPKIMRTLIPFSGGIAFQAGLSQYFHWHNIESGISLVAVGLIIAIWSWRAT